MTVESLMRGIGQQLAPPPSPYSHADDVQHVQYMSQSIPHIPGPNLSKPLHSLYSHRQVWLRAGECVCICLRHISCRDGGGSWVASGRSPHVIMAGPPPFCPSACNDVLPNSASITRNSMAFRIKVCEAM